MHKRSEYNTGRCSHVEYYSQFITDDILDYVGQNIGLDTIMNSNDPYFNDIPINRWDSLVNNIPPELNKKIQVKLKAADDWLSINTGVCIFKLAASLIKHEMFHKLVNEVLLDK